jgi:hypothetical protein
VSALLLVAAREVKQRWKLLPMALAFGFVTLAIIPLTGLPRSESALPAIVGAVLLGLSTALLLGATVIAGELGSHRLGFYFTRPLAWWDIWAGKLLSSLVLAAAAAVLMALPALVVYRTNPLARAEAWTTPFLLAVLVFVFGAAHAAAVAWRSRSSLLLADLALFMACAVVLRVVWLRLGGGNLVLGPAQVPLSLIVLVTAAGAALFLIAGAFQVSLGRTDLQRGHRVLSVAFWTPVLAILAGIALLARWVLNPTLDDLVRAEIVYAAPAGDWVGVAGPAHGRGPYMPTFLVDTAAGRVVTVGLSPLAAFAADGTRAAWLETTNSFFDNPEVRLVAADLTSPQPRATSAPTPIEPRAAWFTPLVFSPGKDRVLVLTPASVSVYALATGERVASVRPPAGIDFESAAFDSAQTIRAVGIRPGGDILAPRSLELLTIDLAGPTLQVTGRIEAPGARWARTDPSGRRLLLRREKARSVGVFDARSGARVADIAAAPDAYSFDAGLLGDGRLALAEALPSGARVRFFDPEGREAVAVPLGRARSVRLGGEPRAGRLAVGLEMSSFGPSDVALVDTAAARLVRVEKGLAPLRTGVVGLFSSGLPVGSPGASLFTDDDGALVRLDPDSGQRRIILPGAPHGGRYP